jgi:competence protein ComEA
MVDAGGGERVAGCSSGDELPSGWARTVGRRQNLNHMSEEELAQVPGVGKRLAHALALARAESRGFRSWDEVDHVSGVGPAKLELLQEIADLRP